MFALPPASGEVGDLKPLSDAIDGLCEAFESDREEVIETLADIIRRRVEFERLKYSSDQID